MSVLRNRSWLAMVAMSAMAATVASTAGYANVIGVPRAEFRQYYPLGANGRVNIQNLYGNVSITAWDRDVVLVEAIKTSLDPRRLEDAQIVVEPTSGAISIHTQYAGCDAQHPPSVEYRITVPRSSRLEDVKLGNGGLTIRGVAGNIKASSVNGSIKAERLEGAAELSTVNGQLEAGFNRVAASQPISLTSVNGPIRLSIPNGAGARLRASNVSGGIDTEFGRPTRVDGAQRLNTLVHRGGAQIRLNNINGGISIHSTWNQPSKDELL